MVISDPYKTDIIITSKTFGSSQISFTGFACVQSSQFEHGDGSRRTSAGADQLFWRIFDIFGPHSDLLGVAIVGSASAGGTAWCSAQASIVKAKVKVMYVGMWHYMDTSNTSMRY